MVGLYLPRLQSSDVVTFVVDDQTARCGTFTGSGACACVTIVKATDSKIGAHDSGKREMSDDNANWKWSGRADLNCRPLRPERSALPS